MTNKGTEKPSVDFKIIREIGELHSTGKHNEATKLRNEVFSVEETPKVEAIRAS